MELLKKAHEMAMKKLEEIKQQVEQNPALRDEIDYNMKHYSVPFLSGGYGARWREDLPKDVRNLLFEDMAHQLVEIRVYPEDPDGHHWGVEYNLLLWDGENGFVRAIDYERKKRGDE